MLSVPFWFAMIIVMVAWFVVGCLIAYFVCGAIRMGNELDNKISRTTLEEDS